MIRGKYNNGDNEREGRRWRESSSMLQSLSLVITPLMIPVRNPNRRIGRISPVLWPSRSSELTRMDFFYFGALLKTLCALRKF